MQRIPMYTISASDNLSTLELQYLPDQNDLAS